VGDRVQKARGYKATFRLLAPDIPRLQSGERVRRIIHATSTKADRARAALECCRYVIGMRSDPTMGPSWVLD
jgi:hypothetical protein